MTNSIKFAASLVAALTLCAGPVAARDKKIVANCSPGEHLAAWLSSVVTDNWCKAQGAAKNANVEQSAKSSGKNLSQSGKGKQIS